MVLLDALINSAVQGMQSFSLTGAMLFFTKIGGIYFILAMTLGIITYLLLKKRYSKLSAFVVGIGGGIVLRTILKYLFKRPRPTGGIINETGYSFPSGHTLLSTIFFLFLIYLFAREIKNKTLRILFVSINVMLILLIGFSRIYLGVHWFTDVIGAIFIGMIWVTISIKFSDAKHVKKLINQKVYKP